MCVRLGVKYDPTHISNILKDTYKSTHSYEISGGPSNIKVVQDTKKIIHGVGFDSRWPDEVTRI